MMATDEIFAGGGETGRRMAELDWPSTPLGPVEAWPQSLRAAVKMILRSRYPMLLIWGPTFTQLYNDAYSQLIGRKHPEALGIDVRITMAEGWDVLGPLIDEAMSTGVATWIPALQLLLERSGYREEAYFSVSHAPAADDEGRTAGMFGVCSEVTDQVIAERRLHLLRELSLNAAEARSIEATCARACEDMAEDPLDVPFAALYLRDGPVLRRVSEVGVEASAGAFPEEVPLDGEREERWSLARAAAGETVVTEDVTEHLRIAGGPWGDLVRSSLTMPVASGAGEAALGVLVAGVSPNRILDDGYRGFFDLLASQVSGAVRNAHAHEEERRRAESLAALDAAKTEFFANVSHEFRTPLTLLLGPLEEALADEEPLSVRQRERLELAGRNARRMLKLVNALLDFSRVEAGREQLRPRPVDLARFTADLASIFRSAVERAGLRLTVDCPPLDDAVAVDIDMWEQIVLNLVSNAVKFTFTGEISVSLRAEGDTVVLKVSDTGIGIPDEELPRLFERFYRVGESEARTYGGTGIGLALVRDLAELHGGHVSARSEPGRGSTFEVSVSAQLEPAEEQLPDASPAPSPRAASGVEEVLQWSADGGPRPSGADPDRVTPAGAARVLVADDNADMRIYLERLLEPTFNVETVADGEAALEVIRSRPPDLVLADVMMPRLDGFELLEAVRRDPRTAAVPIMVLSARSGAEAASEGLRRGADDYLPKPFVAEELVARVHANVSRGRRPVHPVGAPAPSQPAEPDPLEESPPPPSPVAPEIDVLRETEKLRVRIPPEPAALAPLRQELRTFLSENDVGSEAVAGLVLASCEAATNSIEHAQDRIDPVIEVTARFEGQEVRIDVHDSGRWRGRGPSLDRGRGSSLMSALADVRVMPSAEGTLVSLTKEVRSA